MHDPQEKKFTYLKHRKICRGDEDKEEQKKRK